MRMSEIKLYIKEMLDASVYKMVFSHPKTKTTIYKKIIVNRKNTFYQIEKYTDKQVFHENLVEEQLLHRCVELIDGIYLQVNGWSSDSEYVLLISKKGTCTFKRKQISQAPISNLKSSLKTAKKKEKQECCCIAENHNRKKQYLLEEGKGIPPLIDMGIFTKEGKVVRSMYDKYRQINRFVELLDDAIRDYPAKTLHVIDFGCGKSYLTFILYYYLTEIRKIDAQIIGLDLKEDVIQNCNLAAQKYGYTGLHFEIGDINGYQTPFDVDLVITLHACDTATDFALYNAIRWNAKMIFSVPCCQHELNQQIKAKKLSILSNYGIIQERFAALATDAIRGNLLEYCGYKTQLLEFVDFAHTPKNILIRAVRREHTTAQHKKSKLQEVQHLMEEFQFAPTLYQLLAPNIE